MNIIRNIQRVWSEVETPKVVTGKSNDEGVEKYFFGSSFDGHDLNALRENIAVLVFSTDEAYRYYLASYLIAVVKYGEECDVIIDSLLSSLAAPKGDVSRPSYASRVGQCSKDQICCIFGVLDHMVKNGIIDSQELAFTSVKQLHT